MQGVIAYARWSIFLQCSKITFPLTKIHLYLLAIIYFNELLTPANANLTTDQLQSRAIFSCYSKIKLSKKIEEHNK